MLIHDCFCPLSFTGKREEFCCCEGGCVCPSDKWRDGGALQWIFTWVQWTGPPPRCAGRHWSTSVTESVLWDHTTRRYIVSLWELFFCLEESKNVENWAVLSAGEFLISRGLSFSKWTFSPDFAQCCMLYSLEGNVPTISILIGVFNFSLKKNAMTFLQPTLILVHVR